jgi:uncharacterized membrane protein
MTDVGSASAVARRGAPRWMVVALFASLALNLLVIGSLAGAIWRFRTPPAGAGAIIPNLLGYASTLPLERRKELWEKTREERNHVRPFRRQVRAAREETVRALVTVPFDPAAYRAAQERQAETESRARAAVHDLYVKMAESLTAEERHEFPRWREHRRPPVRNLLDEPDQQAGDPPSQR